MQQPPGTGPARENDVVRRRRDFVWAHHPDRGGDPELFIAGMRALDAEQAPDDPGPLPRVIIVRRRPWPVRLIGTAVRRLRRERRPPRVR